MHRRRGGADRLLDPRQALVDALPAGVDQVDEQPEVVDTRVPLGCEIGLQPLEPPEKLHGHPAHLGQLSPDRGRLSTNTFTDRLADLCRKR